MREMDIDPIFPRGEKNDAYAAHFSGQSYLKMLTTQGVAIGNVTFEPGCRNDWHIHHAASGGGQILLCTAGSGWHGAKADSWFTHLAVEVPGEETRNEWPEPVTGEEYAGLDEKRSTA